MTGLKPLLLVFAVFALTLGNAAALQRMTVYIQNPHLERDHLRLPRGGDDWVKYEIEPGYTQTFKGIAPHKICVYDNNGGKTHAFRWKGSI